MAKAMKKVRVASNPHRKPAKKSRPSAAPKKGSHKHYMAKHKKHSNKAASHHKKNPAFHAKHKRRNRRNPVGLGSAKELLISAVAGLGSAVATVQLPQLILQANNTGWMGYLANIGTGIAATLLAGSFAGPTAGKAAMVGAAVIVLDRILTEQFSAIGPYLQLSGVGDATQHHMGTIRDGYFLHPTMIDGTGNMIVPDPVTQAAIAAVLAKYPQIAAPMAQAVAQGPGGPSMHAVNPSALRRHTASGQLLSSRFQSRFNQALN